MKNLKNEWPLWLIILFPYLFVLYFWNDFPKQIPTHFDVNGVPDAYGSKLTGLILLPGINVLMYVLFRVIPLIDPAKKNYALFQDKFLIIRTLLHVFLSFIFLVVIFYSLGYLINTTTIITYAVTGLLLILGNYLGTIRHNYFIGIRTPWTLANEEVWAKTHRFAAKIWVLASVLMMLVMVFISGKALVIAYGVYIGVLVLLPLIYSYLSFKKINAAKS